MVYYGIMGLDISSDRLSLHPYLPDGIHHVKLENIMIDNQHVSIELTGVGARIKSVTINNIKSSETELKMPLNEDKSIQIVLCKSLER